jgi:non-canonical (house-cleaning) NTP pyrophosphatase
MGDMAKKSGIPPKPFEPNPTLEAALERLKRAIGKDG